MVSVFYWDAFPEKGPSFSINKSSVDMDYKSYGLNAMNTESLQTLSLGQMLLRTKLLEGDPTDVSELLQELAHSCLFIDTPLAISYALSLGSPRHLEALFERLDNNDPVVLLMAQYCFSLVLCQSEDGEKVQPQKVPSQQVITRAISLCDTLRNEHPVLVECLLKYNGLLGWVQSLLDLYPDVDMDRFQEDKGYREDSVLGLAMTCDDRALEKVVQVATHHLIPLSDVYLVYVEYLMTSDELPVDKLGAKLSHCIPFLCKTQVLEVFENRILPLIGENMDKLTVYEDFVEQIDGS
jgi:hypothetical protein